MFRSIRPVRVNHLNAVVRDFDTSVSHVGGLYDAEFLLDLPAKEFHACLVETGQVIFEFFAPHDYLICSRIGPHFLGIEYQADMDEVRAALADHNVGVVRDIGVALHTDPADCFGVSFEFYGGSFHDNDWPLLGGGKMKSPQWWRDEHALGLTGLKAYTLGVLDIARASAFLQSFLSAKPLYDEPRPALGARGIGLQVADAVIELVTPDGDGPLHDYLLRQGEGIRSAVFGVRDMAQARRYFAERDIPLVPGTAPGSWAITADRNLGLIFEFAEG